MKTRPDLREALARLSAVPWFEQQGVLVRELVPPQGYDLRILVAAERVLGAIFRVAAAGEWRTNVAPSGVRRAVADPPAQACELAGLPPVRRVPRSSASISFRTGRGAGPSSS